MSKLSEKGQRLTDIELAVLLSLVASQSCIIQTEDGGVDAVKDEIQLIARSVFSLSHAVVQCDASTTEEDFCNGILIEDNDGQGVRNEEDERLRNAAQRSRLRDEPQPSGSNVKAQKNDSKHNRCIANLIVITGLPSTSENVQIQVLELIRTKRMPTHAAVHTAPKMFLFVIVMSSSEPRLIHHLDDHIFISHYHDPEDGFPNLEESSEWVEDDRISVSSVIHNSMSIEGRSRVGGVDLAEEEIISIQDLVRKVSISAEIKAYLQNIVVFLRMHRAVGGGVTPLATRHFDLLVSCLAPINGLSYVTPQLVSLAARKIYPHRIRITTPESERTMQYGSDLAAVAELLEGYTPDQVIDEVLDQVEVPL